MARSVSPSATAKSRRFKAAAPYRRRPVFESLEAREVFSADVAAVEPPPADGSLAAYLSQSHEIGPQLPAQAAAPLDVAAVDEVLSADAPLNPPAEGEGSVPIIHNFSVWRAGGFVHVSGRVEDDDLMLSPYVILNGAQFMARSIYPDMWGNFSLVEMDMGSSGTVEAKAYDMYGNISSAAQAILS